MSLRQEIATWAAALDFYDHTDYASALQQFNLIAESSRIFFNIGLIHATLGEHEEAVAHFQQACELDTYLAVASFQCGVSNFLLNRYADAERDFERALGNMRGNLTIDYDQIGLKFRLYSCEILFNRGLSLIYMGRQEEGMSYFAQARQEKQTPEHDVIDEAFNEAGAGFTVFSIPVGVLYRPPESKLKNLKAKNYLGQAKLIAAVDAKDAFTGFTGATKAKMANTSPLNDTSATRNLDLARSKTVAANVDMEPRAPMRPRRQPSLDARIPSSSAPVAPLLKTRSQSVDETAQARLGPARAGTLPFRPLGPGRGPLPDAAANDVRSNLPKKLPVIAPPVPPLTPPDSNEADNDEALRELYAGYEGSYDGPAESVLFETPAIQPTAVRRPEGQAQSRVAEWARRNANAPPTPSAYSRQPTLKRGKAARSAGGAGNQLNIPAFTPETEDNISTTSSGEITRIRVKLHYNGKTRGMSISPDLPHLDFVNLVCTKFQLENVSLQYKDEDGAMIHIEDEGDFESAVDTAREFAQAGRVAGKLEVWAEGTE